MTRSKKNTEEEGPLRTFAILKTVKSPALAEGALAGVAPPTTPLPAPPPAADHAKENKKLSVGGKTPKSESRYNIFPRSERLSLPCAQYKTEKGYKCPNCQRCYNARKNLVRHVTLECGRDPKYRCPYCSYSKHRRNELKKHVEKKHPDQRPLSPVTDNEPGTPTP